MADHSVWLHVHVPKAGGSTIRQLMNRNFSDGYYNSNSLLETKQYTREEVSEIIRCHPWLRCFSDHKLSLDLPFDCEHANVKALCFVRDPVERFISRYNFHRNFEEVNCIAQKMTFLQFAEMELVEQFVHPQTNSQIYFLNGGLGNTALAPIQAAVETEQTLLLPIEQFDLACIYLEKMFSDDFKDLSYVLVNTSNRKESIDDTDRQFVAGLLKDDNPLIDMAQTQLKQRLSDAFDSQDDQAAALAEFQHRCSRRYHNFRPLREPGEPLPTDEEKAADKSTNLPDHTNPAKNG